MIFFKNHCTDFMILLLMMWATYSSTILSLIIFNFPFVFEISLILLELMNTFHILNLLTYISSKIDILKTKEKSKIMRDNIVDDYITHTMTTRNIKSVQ